MGRVASGKLLSDSGLAANRRCLIGWTKAPPTGVAGPLELDKWGPLGGPGEGVSYLPSVLCVTLLTTQSKRSGVVPRVLGSASESFGGLVVSSLWAMEAHKHLHNPQTAWTAIWCPASC